MDKELEKLEEKQWYMIRIAEVQDMSQTSMQHVLVVFVHSVVSKEISKENKEHLHMIVSSSLGIEDVRSKIKGIWSDAKGNKCLYIKPARNFKQALKYVLKDGDYLYTGISKEVIDDYYTLSSTKIDIKKEISELEDQMILGHISFEEFMRKHVMLKASVGPVYTQHVTAYFRGLALKYGKIDIHEYVNGITDVLKY